MPFVSVRHIEIHYDIRGAGPKVLYVSGTGGDLRRSPNVFDSPLAARFTVLAFDQRGLGQSSRPNVAYTMYDYALDAAALLDALTWNRCSVVGYSFGGMVAQEFALRFPERVSRLVLAGTTAGGAGGSSHPLHEFIGRPLEERARKKVSLNDTRRDGVWQAAHPGEFEALVAKTLETWSIGENEPGRAVGAMRRLEARVGHDTWDRLPQLRIPTLVLGGGFDGIAPPPAVENLARRIPGARLAWCNGGHDFFDTDPQAWQRVVEFLEASATP